MPVLSIEQRVRLSRAAAELRDLPVTAQEALVTAMQLRSHPAREILHALHDPLVGRPLRLVVHGRVVAQPGVGEGRLCGPGTLIGLEGFAEWADRQDLGTRARGLARAVHVLDACVTLELEAGDFDAVFVGPEGPTLRDHLLARADLHRRADAVVRALAATPELAGLRHAHLLGLVDGARMLRLEVGSTLLVAGEVPFAAFVVLAGRLSVVLGEPNENAGPVRSGSVVGQRQVLLHQPSPAHVTCATEVQAVAIPGRRYTELLREVSDFRRGVTRALEGDG